MTDKLSIAGLEANLMYALAKYPANAAEFFASRAEIACLETSLRNARREPEDTRPLENEVTSSYGSISPDDWGAALEEVGAFNRCGNQPHNPQDSGIHSREFLSVAEVDALLRGVTGGDESSPLPDNWAAVIAELERKGTLVRVHSPEVLEAFTRVGGDGPLTQAGVNALMCKGGDMPRLNPSALFSEPVSDVDDLSAGMTGKELQLAVSSDEQS